MADISYTPSIERLAQLFRALPGVGKKSAYRMAFSVLDMPEEKAKAFADATILTSGYAFIKFTILAEWSGSIC